MYFLYNITVHLIGFILKGITFFNKKIKLFVTGRKAIFKVLEAQFSKTDKIIWFHCASLGEFEQGRPIIEKIKSQKSNPKSEFYNHKILLTFFSPSGYEIRKDYALADVVCYLPLDTKKNAKKFVDLIHPEIAIFVKYEFWPNLLRELKRKEIKTILVSGIFRENQSFFKWYGGWMQKSLTAFNHFFVQNNDSKTLLNSIGFTNVTLGGDTRFDRVFDITTQEISLENIEKFKDNKPTLIAGSTWTKGEELLVDYINTIALENQKFIIAPHTITTSSIDKLKKSIIKNTLLFSEIEKHKVQDFQVLIIDSIGLLSKIYNYADISYVGGGFGVGIHNILEPATFGVPIIIGPNYHKFNEAKDLVNKGACMVVKDKLEFNTMLTKLFSTKEIRLSKGKLASDYILEQIGATKIIMDYIIKLFKN